MLRLFTRGLIALAVLVLVAWGSVSVGISVGRHYEQNRLCCETPGRRNLMLSWRETLGLATFYSQIGQDKWVLETVFPGVRDGFFLDVGSGDGTVGSNTKALEERGWRGLCIDPFPKNMDGRSCQMFKEVVFSEAGKRVTFQATWEASRTRWGNGKGRRSAPRQWS
jgi:hypothetical protein